MSTAYEQAKKACKATGTIIKQAYDHREILFTDRGNIEIVNKLFVAECAGHTEVFQKVSSLEHWLRT